MEDGNYQEEEESFLTGEGNSQRKQQNFSTCSLELAKEPNKPPTQWAYLIAEHKENLNVGKVCLDYNIVTLNKN